MVSPAVGSGPRPQSVRRSAGPALSPTGHPLGVRAPAGAFGTPITRRNARETEDRVARREEQRRLRQEKIKRARAELALAEADEAAAEDGDEI